MTENTIQVSLLNTAAPLVTTKASASPRERALRGLLGYRVALVGLGMLTLMVLSMFLAPVIAPHDPLMQDVAHRLRPPFWVSGGSFNNILGTDQFGRDILSRLIYGARVSLAIGFGCTIVTSILGVTLGMISGLRPRAGEVIMRIADAQIAFPYLVLAIAIVAVTGPGIPNLVLLLSIFGWVQFARLVRADVLAVKEKEFVEAAQAIGCSDLRIALLHILPNVLSPVIVVWTFILAQIIIVESSLSFLGFGVPPPTPTWGGMLSDGRVYLDTAWWLGTFPGLAIMVTVLAVNLLGDALRDVLDPRFRA